MMSRRVNRVYRSMNRPLTIWGAERRLFFLALTAGVGVFNFFGSLAAGLLGFVALWLLGAHIAPLPTASTHIQPDPTRTRKLLLHRDEIRRLIGQVERRGYTLVPLAMYWKNGRAKVEVALARGKQLHDKRAAIKEREWARDKARILKGGSRDG